MLFWSSLIDDYKRSIDDSILRNTFRVLIKQLAIRHDSEPLLAVVAVFLLY